MTARLSVLILDDNEGLVARSRGAERIRALAEVRVLAQPLGTLPDVDLAGVQVIMAIRERTRLDAATLSRFPALELILQTGGHAYHLDASHASARGVPVTLGRRAFGANAAVPELTFALAVSALRRLPLAYRSMVDGDWRPFTGRTLHGRTLGILGFGRHGRNVARIAKSYGMKVVVWQRAPGAVQDGTDRLGLDELLTVSDVVSIHLKLSDDSRGLLGRREFSLMKPGSVLINTARGAILDEQALATALTSGTLAAAGLDVFAEEPLPADSPLRTLPNVVLTPHIGWTVEEVLTEFADIAADQLADYLAGTLDRAELLDPDVVVPDGATGGLRAHGEP